MATKVRPETDVVIGAIFCPLGSITPAGIDAAAAEFLDKLMRGAGVASGSRLILLPGERKTLSL